MSENCFSLGARQDCQVHGCAQKKTDAIYSVRRSRVFTIIRAHALVYAALIIDIAISRALINVDYIDTVFTYDKLME